jgi:DNA polymerase-3 subunit epsilon
MSWWHKPLVGFALETTGADPRSSRIITVAPLDIKGGEPVHTACWPVNPGVPISTEAVGVPCRTEARR